MAFHACLAGGLLGALALTATSAALAPCYAAPTHCASNASDPLICVNGGDDQESSIEATLTALYGYVVDVVKVASITPPSSGSKTSGDLYIKTNSSSKKSGSWKYYGPDDIAFISIETSKGYVIYDASDVITKSSYVTDDWTTAALTGNKALSHLTIWSLVAQQTKKVAEPAPLALILVGLGFVAWRRSRSMPARSMPVAAA